MKFINHPFFSLSIVIAFFTISSCDTNKIDNIDMHPANVAAEQSLAIFQELISEQTYQQLGFENVEEKNAMELGHPIPFHHASLDELKAYDADKDPSHLLTESKEYLFPVLVSGQIRSSISVVNTDGVWKAAQYGKPNLTRALSLVREAHASANNKRQDEYIALDMPALYLVFIGHYQGEELFLTHVHHHGDLDFTHGETELGHDLILKISAYATEHQGALLRQ